MGSGPPEQIDKRDRSSGYKRHLKRVAKRQRRQSEKRDPENAPKRQMYKGYSY